ncbi:MAG: energy-coupling factor transporter transmembrane protein EcfT [Ruminococcaceae bacterium]|nr:energy-coupling factor transporter transmembrane protein EcfT [Oscillospiraceae bacterium]
MKGFAFGQYYPADSVMHRLDPRMKVIAAVLYIVAAFLCKNFFSFLLLLVTTLFLILISKIPVKIVLRSIRALIFIMAFTAIINIFWFVEKDAQPIFQWKFITIYTGGLFNALFILVRITCMVIGTGIFLTYTTSPIALTDAIERLLRPLAKIKVPVHEFAMMMTIALRFIPTIVEETDKIMSAQKARGADFTSGSLMSRAKALIPVIIPLFASAFRRAGELATAMECRCYHGGEGRTKLRILKYHARDVFFILLLLIFVGGIIAINIFGSRYGWVYTM